MLSLAVVLAGCSAVQLGYNTLPEISYWWLDGYLDFEDGQREQVRGGIAAIQAWHRAHELPHYAALVRRVELLAPADTTPGQLCALEPELRSRIGAIRERVEATASAIVPVLTAAQLEHLERKYAQRNREYRKDWVRLPRPEQLDKRAKEYVDRAATLYGRLDDDQQALVRQLMETSALDPGLILAERQRRQQDTIAVLRRLAGASPDESRMALRALFDRMLDSPDPAFRAYVDTMRAETCRISAAIHNSTNASQREHAARRLRGWRRDFAELAARR